MMLSKLALRNLIRHKRRSIITALAVAFATLFAVAMRGVQLGTYEENISYALRIFPGFIQVQAPGFQENPTLHKTIILDSALRSRLETIPQIKGYAPRVYADGLASFHGKSLGAAIFGIDPVREMSVTTLSTKVSEGRMFQRDTSTRILLGHVLCENLQAQVGDEIVILAQGYDGTLGNAHFRICGTVKTGSSDFDRSSIFMGLRTLQDLIGIGNRLHVIAISLDDVYAVSDVTAQINNALHETETVAFPWQEVMPDLRQSIELDNISGIVFLGILIVVVAFGILNTVLMSVTERYREFGVLLSLGMPQGKLIRVVFLETIVMTLTGLIIGNILGGVLNYLLSVNPIGLGGTYGAVVEEYGFLPVIRSTVNLRSFLNTTLSILIIAVVSTLYPLYRTWRLEPLKGIRYT